jgi:UDPglucose 6-dehydrogenase
VFICLPETAIELPFLANLPYGWDRNLNYVLKSTVPIGTTRCLQEQYQLPNLVHSPEFLTARCSFTDAQCPSRNIIGIPDRLGEVAPKTYAVLDDLYTKRFPGVQTLVMASDESEAVKLMLNSFFAIKVAAFNEFNQLCEKLGLDWETVRAGILSDGRIAHAHTRVPGPDGRYGFGGTCLPKDLRQLRDTAGSAGVGAYLCKAAELRNKFDRERK